MVSNSYFRTRGEADILFDYHKPGLYISARNNDHLKRSSIASILEDCFRLDTVSCVIIRANFFVSLN